MLIISITVTAQNPLTWNNGSFPIKNYIINPVDNAWYQTGDSIYSIYKIGDYYYANAVKWSKSSMGFAMAFANDSGVPLKNGFIEGDVIYWGVCRDGNITEIKLISTYAGQYDVNSIFAETEHALDVKDNLYYSLNPIWPTITELKIAVPGTSKAIPFSKLMPYSELTPKWTTGYFTPEISGTDAILKLSKNKIGLVFLNSCTIRFKKADVDRGYFYLKIKATVLANSRSSDTERVYKIYWK